MTVWDDCQGILGVSFNNCSLLTQAFVHSSYLNENPDFGLASNERLEFLGDAVLDFVVAELVYKEFPDLPEGELTGIRASLVCSRSLAESATLLELGDWLLLGRGEELSGGRMKPSNLADTMEALVGAIYLDQGLRRAKRFILKQLKPSMKRIRRGSMTPNYKALLQEFVQSDKHSPPTYHLVEAIGPDHERRFTVEVFVGDQVLGQGTGKTKKSAEAEAAKSAWRNLEAKQDFPEFASLHQES